jgi:hypothetical protein
VFHDAPEDLADVRFGEQKWSESHGMHHKDSKLRHPTSFKWHNGTITQILPRSVSKGVDVHEPKANVHHILINKTYAVMINWL